jgi:hypothetical protein
MEATTTCHTHPGKATAEKEERLATVEGRGMSKALMRVWVVWCSAQGKEWEKWLMEMQSEISLLKRLDPDKLFKDKAEDVSHACDMCFLSHACVCPAMRPCIRA